MRVLLTGGTGFIVAALAARLGRDGHDVKIVSRGPAGDVTWAPDALRTAVGESEAVIHLAGENVFRRRWSRR